MKFARNRSAKLDMPREMRGKRGTERESQKEHHDAIVGRCQDVKFCDEGGHRTQKKSGDRHGICAGLSDRPLVGWTGAGGSVAVSLDRAWTEEQKICVMAKNDSFYSMRDGCREGIQLEIKK